MNELDCQMIEVEELLSFINEIVEKGNYNQGGKNNNNYKNGISMYPKKKGKSCSRCGGKKNLMVHHKDGNRKNNNSGNLQTLCWGCHEKRTDRK